MNRPTDNNFKKNWEEVYKERKKIDHLTDARIQKGIERKINSTASFKKWYWVAALFLIFSGIGTLFYFDSSGVSNQHKKKLLSLIHLLVIITLKEFLYQMEALLLCNQIVN